MHSIWQSYPAWSDLASHATSFDCDVLNALKERFAPELAACFSPQAAVGKRRRRTLPRDEKRPSYEEEILLNGRIPTRPTHPHDLYNALIWLTFPQAKMALHTLSLSLHREDGDPTRRGLRHQRLTALDEGGLLLVVGDGDQERAREILALGGPEQRLQALSALRHELFVFGHGLIEVLKADPTRTVTAFTVVVDVPEVFFEGGLTERLSTLDARLAGIIAGEGADPSRIGSLPAWLL